jgi:hypothetical protein
MASQSINFKRGDTFSLTCTRKDGSGSPINLTGYTITSTAKVGTSFSDVLTVTIINAAAGIFTLTETAANTATWPISSDASIMYCDVQFVLSGVVKSSETFIINVIEDITT